MEKQNKPTSVSKSDKRVPLTFRIKQSNKAKIVKKAKNAYPRVTPSQMTEILLEKALALSEI